MTAQEVLARVLEAGGQIIADPQRPRLLVPPAFKPLVTEHREALRELVRRGTTPAPRGTTVGPTPVPALRGAVRRWFEMTAREADGHLPTPGMIRALLSDIRRLWDDVGPAFAQAVHREEARAFYRETRRCPLCGKRGVCHDPERGEERA